MILEFMDTEKISAIPEEMRNADRWVSVCVEWNEAQQRYTKAHLDSKTLKYAKVSDSSTWHTFRDAVDAIGKDAVLWNPKRNAKINGVAFVLGDGFLGIDLDHVITNHDGKDVYQADSEEIIPCVHSYAEKSVSGSGIHIICHGKKPGDRCKAELGANADGQVAEIEMYDSPKFITITGDRITPEHLGVEDRQAQIDGIYDKFLKKNNTGASDFGAVLYDYAYDDMQFNDGLSKDATLAALWDGQRDSADESVNDFKLMLKLAYWCNKDVEMMIQKFRESPYAHQKDEIHTRKVFNRKDYVKDTAEQAIKEVQTTAAEHNAEYQTRMKQVNERRQDRDDYLSSLMASEPPTRAEKTKSVPDHAEPKQTEPKKTPENSSVSMQSPKTGIDAVEYLKTGFTADVQTSKKYIDRRTGTKAFDDAIGGLHPGLYLLGGTPSSGKTALALQWADNLVHDGYDVLFFSLEMTRFELTSRSLSRTARKNGKEYTAVDFRNGVVSEEETQRTIQDYVDQCKGKLIVYEGTHAWNLTDISEAIAEKVKLYPADRKPVCIIDYLQVIMAEEDMASVQNRISKIASKLTALAKGNDIPLIVLSSFNRASYLMPVSMDSFKESGNLEYDCDVCMGLQYKCIQETDKGADGRTMEILLKKKVKEASEEQPRQVVLAIVKNRFGTQNQEINLAYESAYDYFKDDTLDVVTDKSYFTDKKKHKRI